MMIPNDFMARPLRRPMATRVTSSWHWRTWWPRLLRWLNMVPTW